MKIAVFLGVDRDTWPHYELRKPIKGYHHVPIALTLSEAKEFKKVSKKYREWQQKLKFLWEEEIKRVDLLHKL